MSNFNAKTATALAGAMALAASAAGCAAPAPAGTLEAAPQAATQQHADAQAPGGIVKEANVEGSFSFDQTTLSSTSDISSMFVKAAAVLCTSMPEYVGTVARLPIAVGGDVDAGFSAAVEDMADEEGADAFEMACSCASNVAGGGAIANAEVEGVSLASIAEMAQAR